MNLESLLPQWLSQDFFLDWNLENWHEIYRNQANLLDLRYGSYSRKLPQVVIFDNTSERLKLDQVRIQLNSEKFEPKDISETRKLFQLYKRFCWVQRRKLFNDACLRLTSIRFYRDSDHQKYVLLQLQESDYFDYIRTNLCLDAKLNQRSKSLRTKIHIEQNNHQLEDLENSSLANILGINILIFTSDGTLILQQRSSRTLVRPNQICSSVSGTLTKADIPEYGRELTLESLLNSFFREMFEEIGLNTSTLIKSDVKFLGLTRELIRGGQPEVFLAAKVNINKTEIMNLYSRASDRFESKKLLLFDIGLLATEFLDSEDEKSLFTANLNELITKHEQTIAVPLWANLALWCKERLSPH